MREIALAFAVFFGGLSVFLVLDKSVETQYRIIVAIFIISSYAVLSLDHYKSQK